MAGRDLGRSGDVCELLEVLGFSEHTFSETIVVTCDEGERCSCAPMGIRLARDGILWFFVYEGSRTLEALKAREHFTVNIVHEPRVFFDCVFKRDVASHLEGSSFPVPHVRGSDAYVGCKRVNILEAGGGRYRVEGVPEHVIVSRRVPRVYSRAQPAIIEALVNYTKIAPLMSLGDVLGALRCFSRVEACRDVVYRSTDDEGLRAIADEVLEAARKALRERGIAI